MSVPLNRYRYFTYLLFASILILVSVQLYSAEYVHLIIWGDRELTRARDLANVFQVFGSEFTERFGQRTPGGGMYYVLWAIQQINQSIAFIYYVYLVLYFVSAIAIFDIGRRYSSHLAGLFASAVYLTSIVGYGIVGKVWNPLFGFPFAVFGFYYFFLYLKSLHIWQIVLSLIFVSIAAQSHMSNALLIPTFIIFALMGGRGFQVQRAIIMIITVAIAYSPYLGYLLGLINGENFPDPSAIDASLGINDVKDRGTIFVDADRAGVWDLARFIIAEVPLGEPFTHAFSKHKLIIHMPYAAVLLSSIVLFAHRDNLIKNSFTGVSTQAGQLLKHPISLMLGLLLVVNLFAFLAFTINAGGLTFGLWGYYAGQIVPLACLLAGISIGELFYLNHPWSKWFTRFCRLCAFGLTVIVFLRIVFIVHDQIEIAMSKGEYGRGIDSRYAYRSLSDKADLFTDLNATFGLSGREIKNRVAIIGDWERGWKFYREPSEYQLNNMKLPEIAPSYPGCIFVLSLESGDGRNYRPTKEITELLNDFKSSSKPPINRITYESVAQIRSIKIDRVINRDKYVMVAAKMPHGGCPKSLFNDYILTEEEWLIRKTTERVEPGRVTDGKIIPVEIPDTLFSAIVRFALPDLSYPFDLLIKLHRGQLGIWASLHSKQLRNWSSLNGYWQAVTIENPTLEFVDLVSGEKYFYEIFNGALGLSGIRTPWIGNQFNLPAGNYAVYLLAGSMGKTKDMYWFPKRRGKIRYRILDTLGIQKE